jgi:hypothetical protein
VDNEMTLQLDRPMTEAPPDERRSKAPRTPAHDVFVSYSTRDKPVADALVSRLEQANIRCWIAPRDVMPGQVWAEAIIEAISSSRLMVVVLSGAANESPQVLREVERAVASGAVVIPFRIESVEPTGAMAYYLAGEHWLDAMNPPLESHIGRLVTVAGALLEREPLSGAAEVAAPAPPVIQPMPEVRASRVSRKGLLVAAGLFGAIGVGALGLALLGLGAAGRPSASSVPSAPVVEPTPPPAESVPAVVPPVTAAPEPSLVPTAPAGGTGVETSVFDLSIGDCFGDTAGGPLTTVMVVDCAETHIFEVFALVNYPASGNEPYPGDEAVYDFADNECLALFPDYVGRDYATSGYWATAMRPSADTWAAGDREIVCMLRWGSEGEPVTGSARGSGE